MLPLLCVCLCVFVSKLVCSLPNTPPIGRREDHGHASHSRSSSVGVTPFCFTRTRYRRVSCFFLREARAVSGLHGHRQPVFLPGRKKSIFPPNLSLCERGKRLLTSTGRWARTEPTFSRWFFTVKFDLCFLFLLLVLCWTRFS